MSKEGEHKHKGKSHPKGGEHGLGANEADIRALAEAMNEFSASLNRFVLFLEENPELKDLPDSIRELTKRISVLSTRL